MRRFLTVLAGMFLLAGLAAPSALGGHAGDKKSPPRPHEDAPTDVPVIDEPKAECEVLGEVHVDDDKNAGTGAGGVGADTANHNHYHFVDTIITCQSTNQDYAGSFAVQAEGGTDGCNEVLSLQNAGSADCPDNPDPAIDNRVAHGEWDGNGWSHSSQYSDDNIDGYDATHACNNVGDAANRGKIHVVGPVSASGWVKFTRVGAEVLAWGCLDAPKKLEFFVAELTFIPDPSQVGGKLSDATLVGTATLGN